MTSRFRTLRNMLFLTAVCSFILPILSAPSIHAASLDDFSSGYIIDNSVFTNTGAMSAAQIQYFLNAKVPSCDTNGTQPSEYGGGTRAQWASGRGYSAPFTCLKDYSENGLSSAQIIYNAAQQYKINPQILLTLLQKEQGLVTDTWPVSSQYRSATGYGCPDSTPGTCSSQYYGFTNQVANAARMFHSIMTQDTNWYSPYILGNNYVSWNPSSSCGGSTVAIQNLATVALYDYTPYQPNQAALNAGYGSGDSCSSYGNRNFYLYFTDWFGSTKVYDPYGWDVVKTADNSMVYLVVGNTKRWIPSGAIYSDWGLGIKTTKTVTQSYLDSIPTIPPLGRLGYYNNNYYYVDNGKKYLLGNAQIIQAWGQTGNLPTAAPAYVALSAIPDGGDATPYVSVPDSQTVALLIDGKAYKIVSSEADRWRANPTVLNSDGFSNFPVVATADYRINVRGKNYVVDNGQLVDVGSVSLRRDFAQDQATFVTMPDSVLTYLKPLPASPVITIAGDSRWYLLRGGVLYYVPKASYLSAWGIKESPIDVSARLAAAFTASSQPVPLVALNSSDNTYYLLDGAKHPISQALVPMFMTGSTSAVSFPADYFTDITSGSAINSPILKTQEGTIYTVDNGRVYYIPNKSVLNALGYPRKFTPSAVSSTYFSAAADSVTVLDMFVKSGSTTYFLQDGNAFPITQTAVNDWVSGRTVPSFDPQTLAAHFDVQTTQLTRTVRQADTTFVIADGTAYDVTAQSSDYLPSGSSWVPVSISGLPTVKVPSDIVRSMDTRDTRIYLLTNGTLRHILSGSMYSALTMSGKTPVTSLPASVLGLYTQVGVGTDISPAIFSSSSGFKLLRDDGSFLGFSNSSDAVSFLSGNRIENINPAAYGAFTSYAGNITRLIRDPSGKVYWVEDGSKHWITSPLAYQRYAATSLTNVGWCISGWLPDGAPVN